MQDKYINGLPLPKLLVEVIKANRWSMPQKKDSIKQLGIEDADDLALFNLEGMASNTSELYTTLEDGDGEFMGLVHGNLGIVPEGFLDVTKAVVIAATHGDEILCLDYSRSANPRVVATCFVDQKIRWSVVAADFKQLIEIMSL